MNLKFRLERLFKFEYWSFWVFYSPFVLQWLYYSLRSWSFVYFTRANYNTPYGGFFEYSKNSLTEPIKSKYLTDTILYHSAKEVELDIENEIYKDTFIYKPDFGERGVGVTIYYDLENWKKNYESHVYPCLIQKYIDLPIELGVLFYRFPSGKKGVTSVVGKQFLTVVGDGIKTLEELLSIDIRASKRMDFLREKFSSRWNEVIKKDEGILIEEIGNHNRGTTFLNYNHIINNELIEVMNDITKSIPGFHYGRIDLKCNSIEELYRGQHIKIIEVNGVASEAAHIYDPKMSLIQAYKDVFRNNKIIFEISKELKKLGITTPNTLGQFISAWFKQRKRA